MRFLIDFKNDAAEIDIDSYLSANGCAVIKTYSAFDKVYLVEALAPQPDAIVESILDDAANAIDLLSTMSWSTSAMDDWWKVSSALKPDLNAAEITYSRPVVNGVMYLVDSGIDATHPEFSSARISNLFSFNGDFADYNGHGTALASVVVGATCGIVDAQVKSVKIFQNGTPTLVSDLLSAFDAIYLDGISNVGFIRVVNLSWSIAKNTYVESKIQQLIDYGFVVMTSAGNSGTPIENVTPASMEPAITVGAYDFDFEPCDFSNYTGYLQTTEGPVNYGALDVWAPGKDIKVAHLGGGLSFTAGTSIASAIHSAAILFNSHFLQLHDGSVLSYVQSKEYLLTITAGRSMILQLNGVYELSTSKITTLSTEKAGENGTLIPKISNIKWKVVSGQPLEGIFFFPPTRISSYDASNLPQGLYMDNGFLLGTLNNTEEQIINVNIPVVYTDGSQEVVVLKLVALLPTTDVNDPSLDDEIKISLNFGTCDTLGECAGSCVFNRPVCYTCLGDPKNTFACQCIGMEGCLIL